VAFPQRNLQLDNPMKTRPDIRDEVVEILRQRGFEVWWYFGRHYNIRHGQQWRITPSETCNWIKK